MNDRQLERFKKKMERLDEEIEEFVEEQAKANKVSKKDVDFEVLEEPLGGLYSITVNHKGKHLGTKLIKMDTL